jgi:hypothetical protein
MADDSEVRTDQWTRIAGALVIQATLEDWSAIKSAVEAAGGRIIFQKIGPRNSRLWIKEGD